MTGKMGSGRGNWLIPLKLELGMESLICRFLLADYYDLPSLILTCAVVIAGASRSASVDAFKRTTSVAITAFIRPSVH